MEVLLIGVDLKGSGGRSELGEEEHKGSELVVAEGKKSETLVSGDASVDFDRCTSLVGVMSTEADCRFILGGVLGGSILGISGDASEVW